MKNMKLIALFLSLITTSSSLHLFSAKKRNLIELSEIIESDEEVLINKISTTNELQELAETIIYCTKIFIKFDALYPNPPSNLFTNLIADVITWINIDANKENQVIHGGFFIHNQKDFFNHNYHLEFNSRFYKKAKRLTDQTTIDDLYQELKEALSDFLASLKRYELLVKIPEKQKPNCFQSLRDNLKKILLHYNLLKLKNKSS